MQAIRSLPWPCDATSAIRAEMPMLFGDDYGVCTASPDIEFEREDAVWADLPIPVSVTIPLDGPMSCEAVLPAHYEPRYSYPLIVWLDPAGDIEFRERITAISDRNFLSIALHWRGFNASPTSSVTRTAECMHLVESALTFVESVWNIHDSRRFLLAEGAVACEWELRLAEHRPDPWGALVCIRPGGVTANTNAMRRRSPVSALRMLAITVSDDTSGDGREIAESWRRHTLGLKTSIDHRQLSGTDDRSRLINNWLMSCVSRS